MMKPWTHTLADWTKLDIPSAQLIFAQAEEALKQSIETYKTVDKKAERLMQIIFPICLALSAFAIQYLTNNWYKPDYKIALAVALCLHLVVAFGILYKNLFPSDLYLSGAEPQKILLPTLFEGDLDEREKHLALLYNLITGKQNEIRYNDAIIAKRNQRNKKVLKMLLYTPSAIIQAWVWYFLWVFVL